MKMQKEKLLVIGIGNSARSDDGIGWKFIDELVSGDDIEKEYRFQLQIEDAAFIADYARVVFVDATSEPLHEGYTFCECRPAAHEQSFTTHSLNPESVLWLCHELYGRTPQAHVLAISGIHWELDEGLSDTADTNVAAALEFFQLWRQVPCVP